MKHDPALVEALTALAQGMQMTASIMQRLMADDVDAVRDDRALCTSIVSSCAPHSPQQNAQRKWTQVGTDWPQIGGREFKPVPRDIFMGPAFREAYRPGDAHTCYVGRCQGLDALSKALQMPINKVSSCEDGRLMPRLEELGREQHACVFLRDGQEMTTDGFRNWSTYRPSRSLRASPNSPVIITEDALGVIMPAKMSRDEFDERYDRYVAHGSVGAWLDSRDGVEHCAKLGVEHCLGIRYTRRLRDSRLKTESAREIVVFRARSDYDRLIAIIERVVVDHLRILS